MTSPSGALLLLVSLLLAASAALSPTAASFTQGPSATLGAHSVDAIYAQDYGNFIHHLPDAVFQPEETSQLALLVATLGDLFGFPLAIRGNAHTTYAQAQVPASGGVVVDMTRFDAIRFDVDQLPTEDGAELGASVWVGGGVLLETLVARAAEKGLVLPVLPDFLKLTVGGILSNGGIGGASFRHGLMIDNVLELEVVTGSGKVVRCSPQQHAELFGLVLGGLGQYGVIAHARLRLLPMASTLLTFYTITFAGIAELTSAQLSILSQRDSVPYLSVEGFAMTSDANGSAVFYMELAQPVDAPPPQFAGAVSVSAANETYLAFANRLAFIDKPPLGSNITNPWLDIFVPCGHITAYMHRNLQPGRLFTHPAVIGTPILYYPVPLAVLHATPSNLVLPAVGPSETCVYLVATLASADKSQFEGVVALARENLGQAHAAYGAVAYPVGAPDMHQEDWINWHYGPSRYEQLHSDKKRFDPAGILNRGQRIF